MLTAAEIASIRHSLCVLRGRLGGSKKNPLKGFGTGDNARKAAFARWNRVKKKAVKKS